MESGFFQNAIVPRENCLGGENKGWSVAKSLLGDERLLVSRVGENLRICQRLLDLLGSPPIGINDTEDWVLRFSKTRIRLEGLEASALRLLSKFDQGRGSGRGAVYAQITGESARPSV